MEGLRTDGRVIAALKTAHACDKWIAAICAAPVVLAHAGLLDGKNATSYPDFHAQLTGAKVNTKDAVVIDGKIVTSQGPGTAMAFAVELVRVLAGDDVARQVAEKLLMGF